MNQIVNDYIKGKEMEKQAGDMLESNIEKVADIIRPAMEDKLKELGLIKVEDCVKHLAYQVVNFRHHELQYIAIALEPEESNISAEQKEKLVEVAKNG